MLPKEVIIIGGGASVKEGIKNHNLFPIIQNKFTVGLNYCFRYFNPSVILCTDENFYKAQKEFLKLMPTIIFQKPEKTGIMGNTIDLRANSDYNRDLSNGVYSNILSGLFALSLFINLLDEGTIYLLGFDYGPVMKDGKMMCDKNGKALTHWYQEEPMLNLITGKPESIDHRGIGKINWYTKTKLKEGTAKRITQCEEDFGPYASESKVKIYNVSPSSAIPYFEKIDYSTFLSKLDNTVYDQNQLRLDLIPELRRIKKEKNI